MASGSISSHPGLDVVDDLLGVGHRVDIDERALDSVARHVEQREAVPVAKRLGQLEPVVHHEPRRVGLALLVAVRRVPDVLDELLEVVPPHVGAVEVLLLNVEAPHQFLEVQSIEPNRRSLVGIGADIRVREVERPQVLVVPVESVDELVTR